jgi:hypothetical protein
MYYTFELIREEVVEGQPQKHFKVSMFEDEAKTIYVGDSTYIAGNAAYDDPEGEFLKAMSVPEPEKHIWNYQDDRRNAYPPIIDYLDGVVKNDQAQIDAYIAACQAVKTKYPKP